jgi:hypothetical protein
MSSHTHNTDTIDIELTTTKLKSASTVTHNSANNPTNPRPSDDSNADDKLSNNGIDPQLLLAIETMIKRAVKDTFLAHEREQLELHSIVEPLLRQTIRRVIAEQTPSDRPFQAPGLLNRYYWRLLALFQSKTYEHIVFEKTRRYRVEEVFLFSRSYLELLSFASVDPSRHCSRQRIGRRAHELISEAVDRTGARRNTFAIGEHREAHLRYSEHAYLIAVVYGHAHTTCLQDLDHILSRIQLHYGSKLAAKIQDFDILHLSLQHMLEDCLLIQAPLAAATL